MSRVGWIRLFVLCAALLALGAPLIWTIVNFLFIAPIVTVMLGKGLSLGQFGSPIAQYVAIVMLGWPLALIQSAIIVLVVHLTNRLKPSWLARLSRTQLVLLGVVVGLLVGLISWRAPTTAHELLMKAITSIPVAICTAIFVVVAVQALHPNRSLESTARPI